MMALAWLAGWVIGWSMAWYFGRTRFKARLVCALFQDTAMSRRFWEAHTLPNPRILLRQRDNAERRN